MYSSKKNVRILVALLKEHGVEHAVISPGSRNLALVVSLENDTDFTCHSVVDERSAAYYAIGLSLAHAAPVLLSCTSAQATRNYIPGMTEAFYRGVPLVVVTADYRESAIGQGTMQAIDQMSIPADSARTSVRLPLIKDADDEAYCERLVNEALLELRHHGTGPVHIDLPILAHWDGSAPTLPTVKKIRRYTVADDLPPISARRVMVAVGQHAPFSPMQSDTLDRFAERYGAVVFINHLSNYHGPNAVHGSLLIENMDSKAFAIYRPDLLITIGGQLGDYGFDGMMRQLSFQHWRVHEDGAVRDTYGRLTDVFEMSMEQFFAKMCDQEAPPASDAFIGLWAKANARRRIPDDLPLSHAFIAAELSDKVPNDSVMHFAILSALRNWNFFELDPSISGFANVAAFGIDGCLSTFLGHAAGTDQLCFLVIGDLSFFYDMGAVGIRGHRSNARILLVNNRGGGEFTLYSHVAASIPGDVTERYIAASGHHGAARSWVESMGWRYIGVDSKEAFRDSIDEFLGASDQPIVMEVFTTMSDDSEGVRAIRAANTIESLERRIARRLPPRAKTVAKKVLGRK